MKNTLKDDNRTLILVRGLPGSGKSSFAHLVWPDHIIIEADKYFYDDNGNYNFEIEKLYLAHRWCGEKLVNAMKRSEPQIVISNTTVRERDIREYYDLAKEYNYNVVSLIVENRHGNESVHDVPDFRLNTMRRRFSVKI